MYSPNPIEPEQAQVALGKYGKFLESFSSYGTSDASMVSALKGAPGAFRRLGLQNLFSDILVTYDMTEVQRKVMEKASRDVARRSRRVKLADAEKAYRRQLDAYTKYGKTAFEIVSAGKVVVPAICKAAGGFRIVNAGGFNDQVMSTVSDVICEASEKLTKAGLDAVIYGDINVVGSITGSKKLLAHYDIDRDEVFVRANLRGRTGPAVRTIIHELAHRLEFKFFVDRIVPKGRRASHQCVRELYEKLADEYDEMVREAVWDKSNWPKAGDMVEGKWRVKDVAVRGTKLVVNFESLDGKRTAYAPMDVVLRAEKIPPTKVFVSNYARTDPSENFAEMIVAFCMGSLNYEQENMLLNAINEGLGL